MSNAICKWCNKVELVFDNAYKSKTGKLIPLDKTSGLPHQCASNPYTQLQQQQQEGKAVDGQVMISAMTLKNIDTKLDKILSLLNDKQEMV
jgi:hypothetical protein